MGSLLPGAAPPSGSHTASSAAKRSLQIMASFDVGCSVLGAASFGADIAALTWGTPSGGSSTSGGPAIVDASTTADELPVSSPAGGQPVPESGSSSSSPAQAGASPAAAQQPTEQQEQQPQQPTGQQEQQLGLCFFTRAGQLLAVDTLPASCPAAERRWHQLALLYPGDADLQLVAAACGRLTGQQHMASPSRGSAGGSAGGSAAASGRSSPVKPAAATPAPESPRADGGVGTPLPAAEALQQPAAQQYKWWRDGEEPMYLISGPEVRCLCNCFLWFEVQF